MARGDSLARQFQLMLMLDDRREVAVDDAAADLGCARRTVYRDLEVLQRFLPLYQERQGKRARWRLTEGFSRRVNVMFSLDELLAMSVVSRWAETLEGSSFPRAAQQALEKMRQGLPRPLRARLDAMSARVTARVGAPAKLQGHVVAEVLDAIEHRRTLRLGYRKLESAKSRPYTVDPLHLHADGTRLYLIGHVHERRALRVFFLERASSVERTGHEFAPRPEWDPTRFLHGAFGVWDKPAKPVRLRFTGKAAVLVSERQLHPSQVNQLNSDGSVDVALQAPRSPAFFAWLRSFGNEAAILST